MWGDRWYFTITRSEYSCRREPCSKLCNPNNCSIVSQGPVSSTGDKDGWNGQAWNRCASWRPAAYSERDGGNFILSESHQNTICHRDFVSQWWYMLRLLYMSLLIQTLLWCILLLTVLWGSTCQLEVWCSTLSANTMVSNSGRSCQANTHRWQAVQGGKESWAYLMAYSTHSFIHIC